MQLGRLLPVLLIAALMVPLDTSARTTFLDLEINGAVESETGRNKLLDVPFFFAGQKHPEISQSLGTFKSNKKTNAFNKSDEAACEIAFLSAVIQFQHRARQMGADAVVDLKSITKHNNLESATQYRCAAGNVVANVALTGTVVKFGE